MTDCKLEAILKLHSTCTCVLSVEMNLPAAYYGIVCMLTVLNSLSAQECQYWYLYQLPLELSCNPYGGRLQLQCIATGPSQPGLELQWYSSTSLGGTIVKLKPTENGYNMQNIMLGASGMGTASTVLQIEHIEEERAQQCFWCQIAVYGETTAAVQGNTLCILDKSHYAGMPSCSKAKLPIYTTPVCASPPDTGPQLPEKLAPPTTVNSTPEEAPNGLPSEEHLHTEIFIAARTHIRSSPIKEAKMEGSGEGLDNGNASVDALYAAVAVCVIFIVIILILVVVIVVLCKRRSWRNAVSYSSRLCMSKARPHTGSDMTVLENAFSGPADTRPSSEIEVVTALLDTAHDQSPTKSDFSDTEIRCVNDGQNKRQNSSTDHDYSDIEDLAPATKPIKFEILKDKGIDLDNYDHLEPVMEKQNSPNEQSKERFYYSLDDHVSDFLDKSGGGSDHADLHNNKLTKDTTDGVSDSDDYDEVCRSHGLSLEELFDDPKYAAFLLSSRKSHGQKTAATDPTGGSPPLHPSTSPPPIHPQRSVGSPVEKEGSNEPQRDHFVVPVEVHKF